ncbi:MAG: PA containing protein [Actinobacteria bacterium]|nr:PA containing protein [Actinomycetota bacterium]
MVSPGPVGFDKMRQMLARAAELRDREQRQFYDSLEDVRSRLRTIETFAADSTTQFPQIQDHMSGVQDRLHNLPDRTEISVIAERVDEALVRIDAQDQVLAQVANTLAGLVDRMSRPIEQLDARLDGVSGRFEGVSGRLDGLDDRLGHLHSRLDDVDSSVSRQASQIDALPEVLDVPALHRRFDDLGGGMQARFDELLAQPGLDPTDRLDDLAARLEKLAQRLESVTVRLDTIEDSVKAEVTTLSGVVEQGIEKIEGSVVARPDREEISTTMRAANGESEQRITSQLDEALAALAEIMLGRSPKVPNARGRKSSSDDEFETMDAEV